MSNYQLELLTPGLFDHVVRLRKHVFGGSKRLTRSYLIWKYFENPYLSDPLIYVARARGEVVGMRGWFGTSWFVPDISRAQILPSAAETAIAPDHRDHGLFADLTAFAMDDLRSRQFRYVINMSASPANYAASIITMGWKSVGTYETLIRTSRPPSGSQSRQPSSIQLTELKNLLRRLKVLGLARRGAKYVKATRRRTLARVELLAFDRNMRKNRSICVMNEPQPVLMARIADQFDNKDRICHLRDDVYFKWRYRNPLSTYRFVFSRSDSDAFLVFQSEGTPLMRLVDWGGEEETIMDILKYTVAQCLPTQLSTWANGSPAAIGRHLDSLGFQPDPDRRRRGLLVRSTSLVEKDWVLGRFRLLDATSWNLRMIFSDRH